MLGKVSELLFRFALDVSCWIKVQNGAVLSTSDQRQNTLELVQHGS